MNSMFLHRGCVLGIFNWELCTMDLDGFHKNHSSWIHLIWLLVHVSTVYATWLFHDVRGQSFHFDNQRYNQVSEKWPSLSRREPIWNQENNIVWWRVILKLERRRVCGERSSTFQEKTNSVSLYFQGDLSRQLVGTHIGNYTEIQDCTNHYYSDNE